MSELDQTARDYYLVRVINGAVPSTVNGGAFDGLRYLPHEVDGHAYLLSEIGLLEPAEVLLKRSARPQEAGSQQV